MQNNEEEKLVIHSALSVKGQAHKKSEPLYFDYSHFPHSNSKRPVKIPFTMETFYDGDLKDIWDSDLDPVSIPNFLQL